MEASSQRSTPLRRLTQSASAPDVRPRRRILYAAAPGDRDDGAATAHRPPAASEAGASSDATGPGSSAAAAQESSVAEGEGERAGDGAEGDTITLERADFRQLVVALRNLRQQRLSDQMALRELRTSLSKVAELVARDDASALKAFVARHIVGRVV